VGVGGLAGVGATEAGLLLLLRTRVVDQDSTKTVQRMFLIGNDAEFELRNRKINQLCNSKKKRKDGERMLRQRNAT
jgi:hypothetical protein